MRDKKQIAASVATSVALGPVQVLVRVVLERSASSPLTSHDDVSARGLCDPSRSLTLRSATDLSASAAPTPVSPW